MKRITVLLTLLLSLVFALSPASVKKQSKVYLEITLKISNSNRPAAVTIYQKYKEPFLTQIDGAESKELLVRTDDVQVFHGFDSIEHAEAYLKSEIFQNDVVRELSPLLDASPEIKIYTAM